MKIKIPVHKALTILNTLVGEGMGIEKMDMKIWQQKKDEWMHSAKQEIISIFEDHEPVYRFTSVLRNMDSTDDPLATMMGMEREFQRKLDVVCEFYRDLSEQETKSLHYVDSRSCLRYYDRVCPLEVSSQEQTLCKYMFENHDFGEIVSRDVVFDYLQGGESDPAKASKSIMNAAKGVNEKTIPNFGFSVFSLPQGSIVLLHPDQ